MEEVRLSLDYECKTQRKSQVHSCYSCTFSELNCLLRVWKELPYNSCDYFLVQSCEYFSGTLLNTIGQSHQWRNRTFEKHGSIPRFLMQIPSSNQQLLIMFQ